MSEDLLIVVLLDGKVVDIGHFSERREADAFLDRSVREVEILKNMGDPGTWEILASEVKDRRLFVDKESGRAEKAPELVDQYQRMSASYREVGRMRFYEERKQQVLDYLERMRKDKERMQPSR